MSLSYKILPKPILHCGGEGDNVGLVFRNLFRRFFYAVRKCYYSRLRSKINRISPDAQTDQ